MPNLCLECYRLPATACEARRTCKVCGADLETRAAALRKNKIRRSFDYAAHPVEECFSTALFVPGARTLTHEAATLLQYVRALVTIAREIADFGVSPGSSDPETELKRVAVHGFLTGSLDLLWVMRERIGALLPRRVRLSRGLAHKKSKADKGPVQELNEALRAYSEMGVDRLVVVDEVVSGGQLNAGLKWVDKWIRANGGFVGGVLALGVTPHAGEKLEKVRSEISSNHQWATIRLIHVPELLAYDACGAAIKPVITIGTKYIPYRFWGGEYEVRCHRSLDECSRRHSVADATGSAYASTVRAICASSSARPKICWPEISCSKCAEEIEEIRRAYAALPSAAQPSKVVARVGQKHGSRIVIPTRRGGT